ncbi:MAG: ABC transporter related [Clostridiales bacterium 38_11]|nr:MAG: ABC transporter related [Clostridiales bacterium 38_11]HBH13695.1 ABC transporter ATP-binding protein [Clostridiales bacterium]
MNEFIRIERLFCSLNKVQVLRNINMTLNSKEFVSIIGPNGSGKTTLGKVITGIIKQDSGEIFIDNKNIKDLSLPEIGRKIGYLFQNPDRQIFASTVYEELSFALKYKKTSIDIIEKRVGEILDIFELNHLRDASTYSLSQGEKQRLAIGAILLNDPEYLILDEPTTGLDPKRKNELSKLLNSLINHVGILLISHDKAFVLKHSDRIIELYDGSLKNDKKN